MVGTTEEATRNFAAKAVRAGAAAEHFREAEGRMISTVGIGTYLGESDDTTDDLYRAAIVEAVGCGVNMLDTAINYRCQRSERVLRAALEELDRDGVSRDQLVVATKGGYIPFDGGPPENPGSYLHERFYSRGVMTQDDIVAGCHVMTESYLRDQIASSLDNLGLDTIDVYYLHNPETQLASVGREEFRKRARAAFSCLEEAADEGRIGFYGTATWNGYRVEPGARDHLSLLDVVSLAREVGGESHRFRFVQLPFNLGMPEAFSLPTQQVGERTLSLCQAADALGVHVVASASIAQGQLVQGLPDWLGTLFKGLDTDAQRALQFARSAPGLTSALVGMRSKEHVRENLAVARVPPVPADDFLGLFEVDER